tara:strand:+ start:180 stop:1106 length:927 start_codon:yes stop_codon:yes gene_type:complete
MNCDSTSTYVDDRLGETVCSDCGLVLVSNIFEDRVSQSLPLNEDGTEALRIGDKGRLGSVFNSTGFSGSYIKRLSRTQLKFKGRQQQSLNRGFIELNMVLSPYLPNNSLKERAHHYYKRLFFSREMQGYNIDIRAAAIALIVLRENGIPVTVFEVAQNNSLPNSKVSKCARKLARALNKPYILHSMPIKSWSDRVTHDLIISKYGNEELKRNFKKDSAEVIEYVHNYVTSRDITFTKSYMASALWITVCLRAFGTQPEFTQHEIGNATNCTPVSLRNRNKETFSMFNVDKKALAKMTVKQFIAGVRYE